MADFRWAILVLLLSLSVTAADDKPVLPAQQYQALLKEYQDLPENLSRAKTQEEQKHFRGRLAKMPLLFLELAEQNPKDPIAVDALIQVVSIVNGTSNPAGGKDSPGGRALALLLRDHLQSAKLGLACQHLAFGFRKEYEPFLRAVLQKNPHRDVQGLACLSLAHYLNNRLQRLELLNDRPDLAKSYSDLFGKDYLEDLQRQGHAALAKEVETVLELALERYGDVKIPAGMSNFGFAEQPGQSDQVTVGDKAKLQLFELRHLAIGKQAPDIEGADQDGKPFNLSDYRGKVVLLDFWHQF